MEEKETLRDKFAMAALTGAAQHASHENAQTWAEDAYLLADAMMQARKILASEV